jgi:hypothetical protein
VRRAKPLSASAYRVCGRWCRCRSVNKTLIWLAQMPSSSFWNFTSHSPHKKSPTRAVRCTKMRYVPRLGFGCYRLRGLYRGPLTAPPCRSCVGFLKVVASVCHTGPISDLASALTVEVYSSSLDGYCPSMDVPTNSCVDWLSFGLRHP